jgi:hypothetical protein
MISLILSMFLTRIIVIRWQGVSPKQAGFFIQQRERDRINIRKNEIENTTQ